MLINRRSLLASLLMLFTALLSPLLSRRRVFRGLPKRQTSAPPPALPEPSPSSVGYNVLRNGKPIDRYEDVELLIFAVAEYVREVIPGAQEDRLKGWSESRNIAEGIVMGVLGEVWVIDREAEAASTIVYPGDEGYEDGHIGCFMRKRGPGDPGHPA